MVEIRDRRRFLNLLIRPTLGGNASHFYETFSEDGRSSSVLVLGSAAKLLLCGFWVGVDLALILFFGDFRSSKRQ
jgi:hypothetical protein